MGYSDTRVSVELVLMIWESPLFLVVSFCLRGERMPIVGSSCSISVVASCSCGDSDLVEKIEEELGYIGSPSAGSPNPS